MFISIWDTVRVGSAKMGSVKWLSSELGNKGGFRENVWVVGKVWGGIKVCTVH